MKNIKLSKILDNIFFFIIIFFIFFVWINYFVKDLLLSFIISFLLSAFVIYLKKLLIRRKQSKLKLKKDYLTTVENTAAFFLLNTKAENLEYFINFLKEKFIVSNHNEYLLVKNEDKTTAIFLNFDKQILTCDDVLNCVKITKNIEIVKILICCATAENNAYAITSNFNQPITIVNTEMLVEKILAPYEAIPEYEKPKHSKGKVTFSAIVHNAISRSKAKTYFFGGLILLFSSFFIKYNIYYLVFSCIMFLLCILSLFANKIFSHNENSNILL